MATSQIRVKTEGYRAIKSADMLINGITVVAGENGSGKSTLSNLLYYLYKAASDYDSLVAQELRFKLKNVETFLQIVISDLHKISRERNTQEEFNNLRHLRRRFNSIDEEELDRWISVVENVENNYYSQPTLFKDKIPLNTKTDKRLGFIVRDLLNTSELSDFGNLENVNPFKIVIAVLQKIFREGIDKMKSRPTSLFTEELRSLYSERSLPKKFEVYEFEDQIVSLEKASLSIPYLVQNSIYIDTPMMVGVDSSNNRHWDDLNELLFKKSRDQVLGVIGLISNEIIGGDVNLQENDFAEDGFSFKRNDGNIFNLLECATGVKSFAILQLLLKSGSITDKTLLIIDEPESHLHPQWIIEYARVIVLLSKQLGTKFFISSHNPDMISAIRYISEKEEMLNNVNFYLAERDNSEFLYTFKNLGYNIDPIFASFNIALERINKYGI